jgi:hypothetical protein
MMPLEEMVAAIEAHPADQWGLVTIGEIRRIIAAWKTLTKELEEARADMPCGPAYGGRAARPLGDVLSELASTADVSLGSPASAPEEWRHERDCAYVTSDGPAPCTCKAASPDPRDAEIEERPRRPRLPATGEEMNERLTSRAEMVRMRNIIMTAVTYLEEYGFDRGQIGACMIGLGSAIYTEHSGAAAALVGLDDARDAINAHGRRQ